MHLQAWQWVVGTLEFLFTATPIWLAIGCWEEVTRLQAKVQSLGPDGLHPTALGPKQGWLSWELGHRKNPRRGYKYSKAEKADLIYWT